MKLTLAYCPGACSLVPYVLLTEVGAAFDTVNINLAQGINKDPAYLQINPKAKVPALIIDGQPLTENVAIQMWIALHYPEAKLLPEDPMDAMRAISVMAWCASGMHPKITQQAKPDRYCDLEGSADRVRALGEQGLREQFAIANTMLADREWFFPNFSCADAYFYWCFRRASAFPGDLSEFSHCQAHMKRMEQRPSVQKLLAYEAQVRAEFAKVS